MTTTSPPASRPLTALETPAPDLYNRAFWLAYAANLLLVAANALTFRFAEFVQHLGGSESITGHIVRVGLIGSLVVRLVLGQAIDGLGVRRIWTMSCVVFVAGCLMFVACEQLGALLYAARTLFTVGLASMFACSIYHIQVGAPPHRRTEIIGSLGSSGFVGMVVGTYLGDALFAHVRDGRALYMLLFGLAAVFGAAYLAIVLWITAGERRVSPAVGPGAHRLIFRYWPGPVVLVAFMMGVGFTNTTVFLTRFATARNMGGIGAFFMAYAASAFVFRWLTRTWSQTIGRHRMLLLGLAGHTFGYLALIPVTSEWGFVIPACLCGLGHALLFPCVVSLGAGAFPPEYRGTGTTITLAFVDLGTMVSAPLLGRLIESRGFPTVFLTTAACMAGTGVIYGVLRFGHRDSDSAILETTALAPPPDAESAWLAPTGDMVEARPIPIPAEATSPSV